MVLVGLKMMVKQEGEGEGINGRVREVNVYGGARCLEVGGWRSRNSIKTLQTYVPYSQFALPFTAPPEAEGKDCGAAREWAQASRLGHLQRKEKLSSRVHQLLLSSEILQLEHSSSLLVMVMVMVISGSPSTADILAVGKGEHSLIVPWVTSAIIASHENCLSTFTSLTVVLDSALEAVVGSLYVKKGSFSMKFFLVHKLQAISSTNCAQVASADFKTCKAHVVDEELTDVCVPKLDVRSSADKTLVTIERFAVATAAKGQAFKMTECKDLIGEMMRGIKRRLGVYPAEEVPGGLRP
ncbi:hypothetical protein HYFRA_00007823 [Hymenoscyphus fraxineus]|uniref:Uncharacterized protein n=1 Tax=Hymenoscyphus fraxineus TaxID=746836 RepID=A0A9N9KP75_9HELO|nr:hypothetical protein HYFRA_00007823 [Hymenoscyphus fraxineus]